MWTPLFPANLQNYCEQSKENFDFLRSRQNFSLQRNDPAGTDDGVYRPFSTGYTKLDGVSVTPGAVCNDLLNQ
jgi:hypothetical protein